MKNFSKKVMILGILTFLSFGIFSFFGNAQQSLEPIACDSGYQFDRSIWDCIEAGSNCKRCEAQKV